MSNIKEQIRQEIERRIKLYSITNEKEQWIVNTYWSVLSFIDSLPEEPEEESDLQDAEVIFSGYALHTDVTKWADGYKLKIRIYDDN